MDILGKLQACHGIQSGDPDCNCQEAAAEIERLRAALARYGDHEYECAMKNGEDCSCGYEAALKDTKP